MSEMGELMTRLKREIEVGGELVELPCPLCGKPRSQRSDYVRCSPCGMNWLDGEDLFKSPLLSREPYVSSAKNQGTPISAKGPDGTASRPSESGN